MQTRTSPEHAAPPPLPPPKHLADNVLEELWFSDDDPSRSHEQASQSLAFEMARLRGLKPFPVVAERVMTLVRDPAVRIDEVRRVLETDPSLAARTMTVANSALFSVGKPCRSVDQAIIRLGTKTVHDLMATVAVLGMFSDVRGQGITIRDHCVGVAAIGRALVRREGWYSGGQVFLAGLMHDVGKLLLMQTEDISYERIPSPYAGIGHVHLYEREKLGYDHAVLGGHAITAWKIPDPIAKVVAWHHQPGRAYQVGGDFGLMVAIVRLADRLDYLIASGAESLPDVRALEEDSAAATYLDVDPQRLTDGFEEFVQARLDALSAFA
ncbi:MAG TPA: HDOD domain-containing protein [Polyangiaceae bacterium]|nr:HDOD domain-containing protein [Polyangiaceae bacterium]